jgi:xanthine dehydrogenase YagR molybdenum-binding subunit
MFATSDAHFVPPAAFAARCSTSLVIARIAPVIMGLGLALTEETLFDERSGRIMNPSLAEYHVPVHMDVPGIEVIWNDIPDPHSPLGAHGIGEIGITGVGAAVANAVHNATGKRIRELPITLDKII